MVEKEASDFRPLSVRPAGPVTTQQIGIVRIRGIHVDILGHWSAEWVGRTIKT